jgi:hypothetical protein
MDFELLARLAFEKDEENYQKLAKQRAVLRAEEFLTNFKFHGNEASYRIMKEKVIEACKEYELEKIIDRLMHQEIIRVLYPENMKTKCLEKWSV